jgi:1-acyl-sn-glycerol-3-phosphate acyltransferase
LSYIYRISKITLYTLFKVFNRLEVLGSENIPEKGGVIVAANHVSYLDPPLIAASVKRQVVYLAKEGLFKVPILGSFIRLFSIPIRRGRPQPSTIKEVTKRLGQGELILMFPEGSRSINGQLLDAKRGVGLIAAKSRIPVVPAFIRGTEKVLPVGGKFLRPVKITVIFGAPIEINKEETDKQFQERVNRDIIEEIKNLKAKVEQIK